MLLAVPFDDEQLKGIVRQTRFPTNYKDDHGHFVPFLIDLPISQKRKQKMHNYRSIPVVMSACIA